LDQDSLSRSYTFQEVLIGITFLDKGNMSESQVCTNVKYNFFLYPTTGQGRLHRKSHTLLCWAQNTPVPLPMLVVCTPSVSLTH
jgi:hypothetical protein